MTNKGLISKVHKTAHTIQYQMNNLVKKPTEDLLFSSSVTSDSLQSPELQHPAGQTSLSFTISLSLLRLMSIESVMPSNHFTLCCPFLLLPSIFPASGSFPMSQLFASGGQSTRASASASVLPLIFRVDFL